MSQPVETTAVVIAGAGPVGLLLAIDLGRRGVPCTVLEREETTAPWPKMDRSNARTMELFRRLGFADEVRALGYPADNPMDVFICTRLSEAPLVTFRHPSVAQSRAAAAAVHDGSLPLEPYQLVSQNKLEPLLKRIAEATPHVSVRYGTALEAFTQDSDGVTVTTAGTGGQGALRCSYLVGSDGGRSTVRKQLGIALEGDGGIANVVQVIFASDDLYERIPMGKGRHYVFADAGGSTLVAQGDRKEFTLHSSLPPETDFAPVIRDLVGFDVDFDIRFVVPWRYNLLVAERYRDGRVFLAGDSAHLVIPTGGLGMNTGVGDAIDLSWKLAGTLASWGGPGLLDSYEGERRPIGLRNREASRWAAQGVFAWRAHVAADGTRDDGFLDSVTDNGNKMHTMRGVELGYSYAGSPILANEAGDPVTWDTVTYVPSARPGARLPHVWLQDGTALHDRLGPDWTLLDLRPDPDAASLGPVVEAFRTAGAPLQVAAFEEPDPRRVYGADLLLLRPDLHVAWRGDDPPQDAVSLVSLVTGHGAASADGTDLVGASAGATS